MPRIYKHTAAGRAAAAPAAPSRQQEDDQSTHRQRKKQQQPERQESMEDVFAFEPQSFLPLSHARDQSHTRQRPRAKQQQQQQQQQQRRSAEDTEETKEETDEVEDFIDSEQHSQSDQSQEDERTIRNVGRVLFPQTDTEEEEQEEDDRPQASRKATRDALDTPDDSNAPAASAGSSSIADEAGGEDDAASTPKDDSDKAKKGFERLTALMREVASEIKNKTISLKDLLQRVKTFESAYYNVKIGQLSSLRAYCVLRKDLKFALRVTELVATRRLNKALFPDGNDEKSSFHKLISTVSYYAAALEDFSEDQEWNELVKHMNQSKTTQPSRWMAVVQVLAANRTKWIGKFGGRKIKEAYYQTFLIKKKNLTATQVTHELKQLLTPDDDDMDISDEPAAKKLPSTKKSKKRPRRIGESNADDASDDAAAYHPTSSGKKRRRAKKPRRNAGQDGEEAKNDDDGIVVLDAAADNDIAEDENKSKEELKSIFDQWMGEEVFPIVHSLEANQSEDVWVKADLSGQKPIIYDPKIHHRRGRSFTVIRQADARETNKLVNNLILPDQMLESSSFTKCSKATLGIIDRPEVVDFEEAALNRKSISRVMRERQEKKDKEIASCRARNETPMYVSHPTQHDLEHQNSEAQEDESNVMQWETRISDWNVIVRYIATLEYGWLKQTDPTKAAHSSFPEWLRRPSSVLYFNDLSPQDLNKEVSKQFEAAVKKEKKQQHNNHVKNSWFKPYQGNSSSEEYSSASRLCQDDWKYDPSESLYPLVKGDESNQVDEDEDDDTVPIAGLFESYLYQKCSQMTPFPLHREQLSLGFTNHTITGSSIWFVLDAKQDEKIERMITELLLTTPRYTPTEEDFSSKDARLHDGVAFRAKILSPPISRLKKYGITFHMVQLDGGDIITGPGDSAHFGFSLSPHVVSVATNQLDIDWIKNCGPQQVENHFLWLEALNAKGYDNVVRELGKVKLTADDLLLAINFASPALVCRIFTGLRKELEAEKELDERSDKYSFLKSIHLVDVALNRCRAILLMMRGLTKKDGLIADCAKKVGQWRPGVADPCECDACKDKIEAPLSSSADTSTQ